MYMNCFRYRLINCQLLQMTAKFNRSLSSGNFYKHSFISFTKAKSALLHTSCHYFETCELHVLQLLTPVYPTHTQSAADIGTHLNTLARVTCLPITHNDIWTYR